MPIYTKIQSFHSLDLIIIFVLIPFITSVNSAVFLLTTAEKLPTKNYRLFGSFSVVGSFFLNTAESRQYEFKNCRQNCRHFQKTAEIFKKLPTNK